MLMNNLFLGVPRLLMASVNSPPITRGEEGPAIELLQKCLVTLGHPMPLSTRPDGTMDGIFGGEMHKQVCNFQVRNGMADKYGFGDGIIGKLTMAMFDKLVAGLLDPSIPIGGGAHVPKPPTPKGLDPSVRMSIPESKKIYEAYESFRPLKGHLCSRIVNGKEIRNQCAIRMSVALHLADCGFNFAGFDGSPHKASASCCSFNAAHITNATRTYVQIKDKGMHWERWFIDPKTMQEATPTKKRANYIRSQIEGRKGILFMRKCFGSKGSHIDYWNGTTYMNSHMNYHGSGEPRKGVQMLYDTRWFVAFMPVKDTG